ncbi:uncharacterized protein TRAVEDRAFT_172771 [Trametes versicolor FP-101664 SS1]|uniref:uncharacterized protein n=1 Tax=Trametes versicolor (strain FP-101664) TaxID=717944 RepID=UPI000462279F|nr:uncharacterized protein TRAVEDRAFT_172771 [Trametes versicolor FP-101664 SS1]EIW55108.1 hypothetical protein TRAVEDRAFT_172771 [Trametes versicolor FP-101664 SS1]
MPVTFAVSPVAPCEIRTHRNQPPVQILQQACNPPPNDMAALLQCSIGKDEHLALCPDNNGFVHAVMNAYATHHHLVIRPDDVWIAILTQLNFYVNAHAEELRAYFVAHEGTRRLLVEDVGTRHSVDFGRLARAMTREIHKNVVDSTLAEWILPDFTTTTIKDSTICSVLMMSTLKAYFEYFMGITCGIPTVTLEGTKADWERIVKRLERLYELGDEPSAWANMLYPILRRFVSAFDGKPDTAFWKHVVYRQEEYCGQDDLNGWLTAFCVWTKEGTWKAGPLDPLLAIPRPDPAALTARLFSGDFSASYTLDGVPYFTIDVGSIPAGYAEVDVTVVDNGQPFPCKMIAGHLATVATAKEPGGVLNTIAPAPQWFMVEKKTS